MAEQLPLLIFSFAMKCSLV